MTMSGQLGQVTAWGTAAAFVLIGCLICAVGFSGEKDEKGQALNPVAASVIGVCCCLMGAGYLSLVQNNEGLAQYLGLRALFGGR
jgi:hypothetical protein